MPIKQLILVVDKAMQKSEFIWRNQKKSSISRSMLFVTIVCLPVILSSGCNESPPRPMVPGTDTTRAGYLTEGTKFNLAIGSTKDKARATLESKSAYVNFNLNCTYRLSYLTGCTEGEPNVHEAYRVKWPLRNGSIFVLYSNDRVIGIVWEFAYFEAI